MMKHRLKLDDPTNSRGGLINVRVVNYWLRLEMPNLVYIGVKVIKNLICMVDQ